jgi:succinate dehydrogenase/fumarate reductase flavoprotein subunit
MNTELRNSMWKYVGIVRNETQMDLMLRKLKTFKKRIFKNGKKDFNTEFFELKNMISVAFLVTKAAYIRKESRGTHYREDFPFIDNENWLKHICLIQRKEKIEAFFT